MMARFVSVSILTEYPLEIRHAAPGPLLYREKRIEFLNKLFITA